MVSSNYGEALFPQHARMLAASGITPEHARARGYVTADTKTRLEVLGITPAGRRVPGLLIPSLRKDGTTWGYQYRPDDPRAGAKGPIKYETPTGQRKGIDVPPGVGPQLDDSTTTLWITEGVKKADAAALAGLACVALPGVWSWRGTNSHGGKTAIPDWHDIALNGRRVILAFDSDVTRKRPVRAALDCLAGYLVSKGAHVAYLHLPDVDPGMTGLDDYLAAGHNPFELAALVRPEPPGVVDTTPEPAKAPTPTRPRPTVTPITLNQAHTVFRRWLGEDYDTDALDVVLATVAVEHLDGDPLWTLLLSGSGNAKTETVSALTGAGATITSTIASQGALLSATSRSERAADATGGLLRYLGPRGVLVVKDVTSILSMSPNIRAEVLAALREVYDGKWSRNVGTDGGRTLEWSGRVAVIGAVTTAWDRARDVIASMGDRFVIVRMDSHDGRQAAGRRAIGNTGHEEQMRTDLAAAAAGVLAGMATTAVDLAEDETDTLLAAADVVTLARTGVDYDYRGDVIDAHAPEMPTRFAKQLAQVVRGAVAIGHDRTSALRLAIRVARDSMPPLRLAILDDVAEHPESSTPDVRRRIGKPRATVDRQLQALHMLGVLACEEEPGMFGDRAVTRWLYSLAEGIDPRALDPSAVPDSSVPTPRNPEKALSDAASTCAPHSRTEESGTAPRLYALPSCPEHGEPLDPLAGCVVCALMATAS